MSEPQPITDRSDLERRLFYSVVVAGKSATFANGAVDRFLPDGRNPGNHFRRLAAEPFAAITAAKNARTGNYRKVAGFILSFAKPDLDLTACSAEDLETLHGVGPKTARFFLLWTRPGVRCAALDVHVLRWLRGNGYPTAPKASPQASSAYAKWEAVFLAECDRRKMTARELDYQIWTTANAGGIT